MIKRAFSAGSTLALALALCSAPAYALCDPCQATQLSCNSAMDSTTSHIAIGGPGSLSSNDDCGGVPCDNPGKLDQGTIAEAYIELTLDRVAGTLTVVMSNNTDSAAALTAIYFNAPAAVTGLSLASQTKSCAFLPATDCPPDPEEISCSIDSTWSVLYQPNGIGADGFGQFDVYVGNGGDTGNGGGNPIELQVGESLTVVLDVSGDLTGLTACDFASLPSSPPPGDNTVVGVGRFQDGFNNGDSGWLGPCSGGDLLVDLKFFRPDPDDGRVTLNWSTASELDNAGFYVLRKPEIGGGPWVRLNASLIPGYGTTLTGADYSFTDTGLTNGVRYQYRLEDVDIFEFNTLHAPEMAVANPRNPAIRIVAPAYGRTFGDDEPITLEWRTAQRGAMRVQFSGDPAFPEGNRVEFPARAGRSRGASTMTLNQHERMLVASVMNSALEGQIYWRVVELVRGSSSVAASDVSRFGKE